MSKYQFNRLGSDTFQEMVQSLLETKRRNSGGLIQFGSAGADGAREATWTQAVSHPEYIRPSNSVSDVPKQWIFQVKFHDIGLRGWAGAAAAVVADLKGELEKVTVKYSLTCHHYVLITNVPLTGASRIGTRDKVMEIASKWEEKIPDIEVWDAADLSRMLDNNPGVRTTYEDLILPGDVLSALHRQIQFREDRVKNSFRGYLKNLIDNESKARAEEAGDDDPLPLSKIFIDQTLHLDKKGMPECYREDVESWQAGNSLDENASSALPENIDCVSSAFPLLWGEQEKVMLLAGPGYGKSTITQFIALYHAARIIDGGFASCLAQRLKLPESWTPEDLDAFCTMRFPFRVELRRYAKWRKALTDGTIPIGIASYIARQLIGGVVESALNQDDIFGLVSSNPTLLILDGLDEVPNKDDRDQILKDCDAFLYRCSGENVDLQIVMSSRPQGYHGEFDRFQPLRWVINDLAEKDFYDYAAAWLTERIKNAEERSEAEERIKRGMASDAVRRLATTLLQATVMLTIVRKKNDIPEERHKLFEKYVDVVFQREKSKNELIARYEPELKLLHEMVGYQIHEAVARGENDFMPEAKFKDLVWTVWRLIRGNEQIHAIPNQEIQSIYDLSTDRLVFLSGKGTSQSDIDFVIQPYREYFAANYMANKDDADPEKVFNCLVERGAYWQQVLRFFVAITTPAQRSSWALAASIDIFDTSNSVKGLPARRAVMFSLPEFSRLHFAQFCKIIAGCMRESEWWTWIGQEWIISIIGGLRSGEAWRELWKTFNSATTYSYGTKLFALSLFPRVIPPNAEEFNGFIKLVLSSLSDSNLSRHAIRVILQHELPVDFALADENALFEVLDGIHYRGRFRNSISFILDRLSRPAAVRFLCTMRHHFHGSESAPTVWGYLGLPLQFKSLALREPEFPSGSMLIVVPPAWLNYSIGEQANFCEPSVTGGPYESYICALFSALQKPDDLELHKMAFTAMHKLPGDISWDLRYESVLGPSPDRFNSKSDWINYKTQIRLLFSNADEYTVLFSIASTFRGVDAKSEHKWTTLLFPPSHWDKLVAEGLIGADFVAELRKTKWAMTSNLGKDLEEFVAFIDFSAQNSSPQSIIPFCKLMKIAVDLYNKGDLQESLIVGDIFALVNPEHVCANELHLLINDIQNPSKFPTTWGSSLISMALSIKEINVELIINFWSELHVDRKDTIWFQIGNNSPFERHQTVITKVLNSQSHSTLDLLWPLVSQCSELSAEISEQINQRAALALLAGEYTDSQKKRLVRCMVATRPSTAEIKIYGDHRILSTILSDFYGQSQLSSRILLLPQILNPADLTQLRCDLTLLLSRKDEYPPEVAAAALDALIQLDVANCSPISEEKWRADL